MAQTNRLAFIGGSGLYQIDGISPVGEHKVETPFGAPSDVITEAKGEKGDSVFFLPRHGRGHRFTPSEIPYRANIYALKSLGVTHVVAVSAVGIMKEEIRPGDLVIPDQLFDRTKGVRPSTFFGDGVVGHVAFADPYCEDLRQTLIKVCEQDQARFHAGGACIAMEGPQFSTRAESKFYRKTVEPSVIGMTSVPEAKLAREAEMSYAMLALATDYDCWHEGEDDVSVEAVIEVLKANTATANRIVKRLAESFSNEQPAPYAEAAKFAIMTKSECIPAEAKERLQLLYGKYLES